ncbi:glycine-rich protein-like [Vanessa cardui]|uniref:glycine-rich protein-like n=1 Tax=Vanessa cardui TaxID=171605 RepID=UPI001F13516C|nr:glycine-rich protein-like [Vanessa cardui]
MYKAVLLVCALALLIQSIAGACIGNGLGPFGIAGPLGLNEPFGLAGPLGLNEPFGLAGPFGLGRPLGLAEPFGLGEPCGLGPLGAPYGAYGAYGLGYGIGNYAGLFRAGYGYGALL